MPIGGLDSNYDDDMAADDFESELTRLWLENQALQLHLCKFVSQQEEADGTEASSTWWAVPPRESTVPPIPVFQNQAQAQKEGWLAEKAKAVQKKGHK